MNLKITPKIWKNPEVTEQELYNDIINNNTFPEIVTELLAYVKTEFDKRNNPPIFISQRQFEDLMSLFHIRGTRVQNGELIKDNRGGDRRSEEARAIVNDFLAKK